MPSRKKTDSAPKPEGLPKLIKKAVKGLSYMSETDAAFQPFVGRQADAVTGEILLSQIGKSNDTPVEERNFEEFFARLTGIQDWFGDEEKQTAQKFSDLKNLLQNNLKNLKVFKVGQINLDIYVVGLDAQSLLTGVKTEAVET